MVKGVVRVSVLSLLVFCMASGEASAFINGTRAMGFSAKSIGRGGFDIAVADDSTSINVNPAGMAFVEGGVADANITMIFPGEFRFTNPNNPDGAYNKDRFLLAPVAGAVLHPKGDKLAVGFSLAAPDALATDYTIVSNYFNANPLEPSDTRSRLNAFSEWIHLRLSPAVAYAVSDKLAVGMRFGIEYMTLDLMAPLGRAYLNMGQADSFGFSFGFGVLYRPFEALSIGVSGETQAYMSEYSSRSGDAFVKLDATGLPDPTSPGASFPKGSILEFNDMKTKVEGFEAPPVVGVGLAFEPTEKILVGMDFRYLFWSETNSDMLIKLNGGDVDVFRAVTGVDSLTVPFRYEDSMVLAVGGSYKLMEMMTVSLGYNYGEVVTADNFANYLAPVVLDHHLTLGSTLHLGSLDLSAAYSFSFRSSENNSNPSGVDQSLTQQLGGLPPDTELNDMEVVGYWSAIHLQFSYHF
jgi:long-chain fatty acid transport protein